MILQALTEYYHTLEQAGKIAAPGWSPVKVSFALQIGPDGALEQVISVQTEQQRGKKTVWAPQVLSLRCLPLDVTGLPGCNGHWSNV